MLKKNIAAFLSLALLTASFVASCSSDGGSGNNLQTESAASAESAVLTEEETTTELKADVPEKDYDGYEFRFVDKGLAHNLHWHAKDIYASEQNGDALNDAVYTRNSTIQERFNIVITENGAADPLGEAKKAIMSGDDLYDVVNIGLNGGIESLQASGYLVNLYDVPYLNLDSPWWDERSVEDLSIGGKLYGVTGDIIIMDKDATWVMLFSKGVIKNYNLDDIYELIDNNSWTYEKFAQMVDVVSGDLNGDGKMDIEDAYGHAGEAFNTFAMLTGFGDRLIAKDENDLPYVAMMKEDAVTHLDSVLPVLGDKSKSLLSNNITGYSDTFAEAIHPAFGAGHILFYLTGLNRVTLLRDQEADFGIVPMPKWDENQERYYNAISLWAASGISVPVTSGDLERTGILLEALCAESTKTLRSAYYDIALKGKGVRDTESEKSLDTIFNSRVYELGVQYNWGGISGVWQTLTTSSNKDVVSEYAKIEAKVASEMQKTIDSMTE